MRIKITDFDVSEYLKDEKSIAAYLSAVVEENDPKLLLGAIGDIAKARGMARIAIDSGLGRESLYKALHPDAKPRFDTIVRVLNSLGVRIGFQAIGKDTQTVARPPANRTVRNASGMSVRLRRNGSKTRQVETL